MTWTKVAGSCQNGPCPTFYVDHATGNVRVQGNRVAPQHEIPDVEGMVEIPASDWQNLIRQYLAQSGE